jgi:hypothetical protein
MIVGDNDRYGDRRLRVGSYVCDGTAIARGNTMASGCRSRLFSAAGGILPTESGSEAWIRRATPSVLSTVERRRASLLSIILALCEIPARRAENLSEWKYGYARTKVAYLRTHSVLSADLRDWVYRHLVRSFFFPARASITSRRYRPRTESMRSWTSASVQPTKVPYTFPPRVRL